MNGCRGQLVYFQCISNQCRNVLCCLKSLSICSMNSNKHFASDGDIALSFSGCGFLGTYHFGVLSCLKRDGANVLQRVKRCAGASAGSLVAALFVFTPNDTERGLHDIYQLAQEIISLRYGALTPGFLLHERLAQLIEMYIPEDISQAQDRLFISVTDQKKSTNRLVSHFESRNYLIQCLAASCYIPMYSKGMDVNACPPVIDGEKYIDGGYTNNLPVFDDMPTLTISPFSGSSMIAPHDCNPVKPFFEWRMHIGNQQLKVNMQNIVRGAQALFPPSLDMLERYYEMGFRDALKFLIENELIEREEGSCV